MIHTASLGVMIARFLAFKRRCKMTSEDKAKKFIKKNLSLVINSKPGFDIFYIEVYFHKRKIGEFELPGIELAVMGYKG